MKTQITFLFAILFSATNLFAQNVLYSENFNSASPTVTFNTTDMGCVAAGQNLWINNTQYLGGTGTTQFWCAPFSTFISVNYNQSNTPNEPAGITGFPNSSYAHITAQFSIGISIPNASFIIADGICVPSESYFMKMTNGISTLGQTNVRLKFWWLCAGGTNTYGDVFYSTNGGTNWTQLTSPINHYMNQSTWVQAIIPNAAFDNVADLRFGWRFVNQIPSGASNPVDPSFGIDDIVIDKPGTNPVAAFTMSDDSICAGDCISLADSTSGNPIGWNWSFPGATPSSSTQQNPSFICYQNAGTYPITLISINASGNDTITVNEFVGAIPPTPTVIPNGANLASSAATGNQWYFNATLIPGATGQFYTATQNGFYTVVVTINGCSSAASIPTAVNGLGINNSFASNSFSVFPTMTNDKINIVNSENSAAEIELLNVIGEKVLSSKIDAEEKNFSFDISSLSTGIYLLKINSADESFVARIVKQ